MTTAMQWANALSTRPSLEAALNEVTATIQHQLTGKPDLGIVFLSSAFASDALRLMPLLLEKLPIPTVIGCLGGGIVGTTSNDIEEIEQGPALSLSVGHLPGVTIHPFQIDGNQLPDLDGPPQAWIDLIGVDPADNPHFILLVDPMAGGITDLLAGLDFAYPRGNKIGGLASGGDSMAPGPLFYAQAGRSAPRLYGQGTVGVALSGAIQVDSIVAQGCRPIGKPFQVTDGERNIITEIQAISPSTGELITAPPLEVLRELVQTLNDSDRELAQTALFVGVAMDSFKLSLQPGDFLIRNLLGVDPRQGAIAIGDRVRRGQRLQFHLRDAQTSAEDLQFLLSDYLQAHPTSQALGALMFSCLGRGTNLYPDANFDSQVFQRFLPGVPLGGFFCNGEIGPVGQQTFLHGYTSAFAILRPANP
ncbi:FIST N-terminal domain-containing protein [Synechocystis sp. LKSZ1]|uniref:FIST signal transduction protein n=1 Tax=Synechocystis sp. LKSZ1 TaxID=3144951 RepID=UPI00336C18DC